MLHVILTILKIIGILLLVLIALFILLILAVLFAPIRYQIAGAFTEEERKADVHLTWLLHFLSFTLAYDQSQKENGVKIKILGIDPKKVSAFFKKRKKKKKKKSNEAKPDKKSGSGESVKQETQTKEEEPEVEEEEPRQEEEKPRQEEEKPRQEEAKPQQKPQQKSAGTKKKPADQKRRRKRKKGSLYERITKFFKKQVYKLQGICDRIEKINDSRPVIRETEQRAARLLHHYRVRAGSGYLKFGTGDPAATAELTGFLYILLPASCGKIEIDPLFTKAALQTDLSVRGHIRLIHLLRAVLWGVFNKDFRRLIRDLRGS